MTVTHKVKMDLVHGTTASALNVVQGDCNTRAVAIILSSNTAPWPVPEGTTAAMRYRKKDNTGGVYDSLPDGTPAWSISENVVTMILAPQMLTTAGIVQVQLELIQGTDILATFPIELNVIENPASGVLRSKDYVNWLEWMKNGLDAAVGQTMQAAQDSAQMAAQAVQAAQEVKDSVDVIATSVLQAKEAVALDTETVRQAKEETQAAAEEVQAIVAGNEAYTKQECNVRFADRIIEQIICESASLADSTEGPLYGLKLMGRTAQNGQPNPETPAALVSAGSGGSVEITVDNGAEPQMLRVATPNGMPGIPVSSGGNFTDGNGQQWICDEVDFARGKYVQRVTTLVFDGSADEGWQINGPTGVGVFRVFSTQYSKIVKPSFDTETKANFMCSNFTPSTAGLTWWSKKDLCAIDKSATIYVTRPGFTNADTILSDWQNYLAEYPMTIVAELANPVETDLPVEVQTAYTTIHTGYLNTNIVNNGGSWMEIRYAVDTKAYIDQKLALLAAGTGL